VKFSEKILSTWLFVYYKSHMDWSGIKFGLLGERPQTNPMGHGKAKNEEKEVP
jgi:hypothetical protein